ncbi:MAG: hypothetical protein ACLFRU_06920, partial [Paracoccaceae bacterium]
MPRDSAQPLRQIIDTSTYAPEAETLARLIREAALSAEDRARICSSA